MPFTSIDELRQARDAALAASDYLLLEDAPYPEENRAMAIAYRTELRDLPWRAEQIGLENIELPDYSVFFSYRSFAATEEVDGSEEAAADEALADEVDAPTEAV